VIAITYTNGIFCPAKYSGFVLTSLCSTHSVTTILQYVFQYLWWLRHVLIYVLVKVKVPRNRNKGPEVQLYSFWTSVLKGMGGQYHAPAALSPGKTRYPLYRRLGGLQGRSGRMRNISPNGTRSPDHPALSQSPYRLSYPGPVLVRTLINWIKNRKLDAY
jgi:hypothetical protein